MVSGVSQPPSDAKPRLKSELVYILFFLNQMARYISLVTSHILIRVNAEMKMIYDLISI